MKLYKLLSFLIVVVLPTTGLAQAPNPAPYNSTGKYNYVRTWTATAPVGDTAVLVTKPVQEVTQSTQYFDGLGRHWQTVLRQGSLVTGGTATDLVSPVVYDAFGRETYRYLPFAANATGGNTSLNDGLFKLNPFQQDSAFNIAQFPGETFYYSKTQFEPSPLDRVSEVYAPGNSWVGSEGNVDPNTRRSVSSQYLINDAADSVRIWTVASTGTIASSAMYPSGTLRENVTIDEHKKKEVEYKDNEGKVVLKKVQLANMPATGHYGWLCTYYVYDDLDNLRLVIQPRGVELLMAGSWSLTPAILNEFCFRYEYDEHKRMVVKKVPGAGEVWMVYDAYDRLVLTMDSLSRSLSPVRWLYTQYDALSRPLVTGLWNNANDRLYHKAQANSSTAYPNLSGQTYEELTWTYYDDYTWAASLPTAVRDFDAGYAASYLRAASNTVWPYPQAVQKAASTKSLVTGGKVKVLGSNPVQVLATVTFYDNEGRVIQVRTQNITGGVDVVTTQYSWSGQPLVVVQRQEKLGTNPQTHVIVTKMDYDELGRLLTVKKAVSSTVGSKTYSKAEQVIVSHEYDALGQLRKKTLGSPVADSLRYEYNIRGWLLGANRAYARDNHQNNYFGFDLGYDKTANELIGNQSYTAAQYNGNIAGTVWKSKGDGEKRKYDFGYDAANRIQKADFTQYAGSGAVFNLSAGIDFTLKGMSYDANGNILGMTQKGWKLGGSTTIDSLQYTYENSNKLKNVIDHANDAQTKLGDFRSSQLYMTALSNNKTIAAVDYIYDGNGNMIRDRNKDIGDGANNGIVYNYLNLPGTITIRTTGGAVKGTITYTYDAAGNKLKKTVQETGQPAKTTLYLGGLVYENDTLQFISHEEGRLRFVQRRFTNGDSAWQFQHDYFLKDHLGNVRMVLTEQRDTAQYLASMEAAYRAKEDKLFYNIPQTNYPKALVPGGYPVDGTTNPNDSLARTNGSGNKIGPAIVLKVMSGDKVDIGVNSFYRGSGAGTPANNTVADIVNSLASGIVGLAGESKGTLAALNNGTSSPLINVLNSFRNTNNSTPSNKPKAYLNWILLDEQLQYVAGSSGADPIKDTGFIRPLTSPGAVTMTKNGFLYIYVSNETQNRDVFFDNLSIRHISGPITEETHYYPFGLTMAGISSKSLGKLENKYKFNDGNELQSKEFSDGNGLELYDAIFRMYDPQIGQFHQPDPWSNLTEKWSPYSFAFNNPISFNDPLGLTSDTTAKPDSKPCADCPTGKMAEIKPLKEVTVTEKKPLSNSTNDYRWYEFFNDHNPGGDFLYELNKWNPLANFVNSIKTYATGSDTYGVKQNNKEATAQLGSVFFGGILRTGNGVITVGTSAVKHGFKYASRIRARALQDPVAHNFPYSFDDIVLSVKPIIQADGSQLYRMAGSLNGKDGFFEIAINVRTGEIFHRTFVGGK